MITLSLRSCRVRSCVFSYLVTVNTWMTEKGRSSTTTDDQNTNKHAPNCDNVDHGVRICLVCMCAGTGSKYDLLAIDAACV
jgi:hypothetical protein